MTKNCHEHRACESCSLDKRMTRIPIQRALGCGCWQTGYPSQTVEDISAILIRRASICISTLLSPLSAHLLIFIARIDPCIGQAHSITNTGEDALSKVMTFVLLPPVASMLVISLRSTISCDINLFGVLEAFTEHLNQCDW